MSKSNRSIYQSIYKDINKGIKRFYWYNYQKIKNYYLIFKLKNSKKKLTNYSIGILYPTRERSLKFERMLETLSKNCSIPRRVNILLLFDTDEPELDKYKKIIDNKKYSQFSFKIYVKDLVNHAARNNYLASESKDTILFPVNDDIVFNTTNWDAYIDHEFSKIDINLPYCVWPDTGQKYSYLHSDFPIINKAWFDRLGYVSTDIFNHWYFDTWICDLCLRSKVFHITPFIKIHQFSAHTIKEEVDATHLRNANTDKAKKDKIIWDESINIRIADSKKLSN